MAKLFYNPTPLCKTSLPQRKANGNRCTPTRGGYGTPLLKGFRIGFGQFCVPNCAPKRKDRVLAFKMKPEESKGALLFGEVGGLRQQMFAWAFALVPLRLFFCYQRGYSSVGYSEKDAKMEACLWRSMQQLGCRLSYSEDLMAKRRKEVPEYFIKGSRLRGQQ